MVHNDCFLHIEKITIDNVLRSFQFKLLHRIIYVNDKLFLFNITQTTICDFCNDAEDSIEHRFWKCRKAQEIWGNISRWYTTKTNSQVDIQYHHVVSNKSPYLLLDFVILSTKYYIYKCFLGKCKPSLENLIREIKHLEAIEKDIAVRKGKIDAHNNKWKELTTIGY